MKIALGQIDIIWENKEYNKQKCRQFAEKAKKQNAQFIVFPEMTLTGFTMHTDTMAEDISSSESIAFFQSIAKEIGISIGFGIVLGKKGQKAGNHFILVDKEGTILCNYQKIHPFSYGKEAQYYEGGTTVTHCVIDTVAVSPLICYDLRFPEIFQQCSKNSQLILVIASWPVERLDHWLTLLKARAIENQCYVAGINRTGNSGKLQYNGHSVVYDPLGNPLTSFSEKEELLLCDINPEEAKIYQNVFPVKKDRKPNVYRKFYE